MGGGRGVSDPEQIVHNFNNFFFLSMAPKPILSKNNTGSSNLVYCCNESILPSYES